MDRLSPLTPRGDVVDRAGNSIRIGRDLTEYCYVDAVQVPHQPRQVGLPRVQHEVIVIAHQAVRQHLGVETVHRLPDQRQQRAPVVIIDEDRLAPVAARSDVVDRAGEFDTQGRDLCGV